MLETIVCYHEHFHICTECSKCQLFRTLLFPFIYKYTLLTCNLRSKFSTQHYCESLLLNIILVAVLFEYYEFYMYFVKLIIHCLNYSIIFYQVV